MSKISAEITAKRIHFGYTDNYLVAGFIAAVGATFLATMFGEWYGAVGWTPFSFNVLNAGYWAKTAAGSGIKVSPDFTYFLGMWAHYSQGIIFGLLFALFVHANFPGPLKTANNLLKGLMWGWTLFLVSSAYIMPLLYGAGFLFSVWGTQNLFYNFVWHSTYGFTLALFYNPLPKPEAGVAGSSGSSSMKSMGSAAAWGQVVLGWIVILIGGWVSTSSAAAASWGVIIGLVGLVLATGPTGLGMRKKM